MTIYKSCSPKYTHDDIKRVSGTQVFVSYERLLHTTIYQAINKKDNDVMVGMKMDIDGITVYIESKEEADKR